LRALWQKGDYEQAAIHYTHALETSDIGVTLAKGSPEEVAVRSSRSTAYVHLGKLRQAAEDASCVIHAQPTVTQGYALRAVSE
jgi:hypothetical protein